MSKNFTPITIAAPVSLFVAGLANHEKKLWKDEMYFAGGYILSEIFTQGAKHIVQRKKPFNTYSFIEKRADGGNCSFPWGPTSSTFHTNTILSILYVKRYVIAPSY